MKYPSNVTGESPKPVIYSQGGGNKAARTSGFLKGLSDCYGVNMYQFQQAKAASGGAIAMALFHSNQNYRAKIHWMEDHNYSELMDFRRILTRKRIFDTTEITRRISNRFDIDTDFDENAPDLLLGITWPNGLPDYIRATRQNFLHLMNATAAIPFLIGPLITDPTDRRIAYDGAFSSMIPEDDIQKCSKHPNHKLILLNTMAPDQKLCNAHPVFENALRFRPKLREAFKKRAKSYEKCISLANKLNNVHIFGPKKPMPGTILDKPEVVEERFEEGEYEARGSEGERFMEALGA